MSFVSSRLFCLIYIESFFLLLLLMLASFQPQIFIKWRENDDFCMFRLQREKEKWIEENYIRCRCDMKQIVFSEIFVEMCLTDRERGDSHAPTPNNFYNNEHGNDRVVFDVGSIIMFVLANWFSFLLVGPHSSSVHLICYRARIFKLFLNLKAARLSGLNSFQSPEKSFQICLKEYLWNFKKILKYPWKSWKVHVSS